VGHEGGDIAVAQMEYPFNDLLLCLLDGALFRSFIDDGFDLIFRNGPSCEGVIGRT